MRSHAQVASATNLITFHFDNLDMRIEIGPDGEPWFCAKDVCDILGILNTAQSVENLDDDERLALSTTYTNGRKAEMIFVSESGLYALIFQSRKPEARRFRKWVTKEVLPAIRKMGYYGELSFKERVACLKEIDFLEEQLLNTKNILLFRERVQTLHYLCHVVGRPMPNLDLLFQETEQLSLEGFGVTALPGKEV